METRADEHIAADVTQNLFHRGGGDNHSYRKMIYLMTALRTLGLDENTVAVFACDKGGERIRNSLPR